MSTKTAIIKNLPTSINKRLGSISANNESVRIHQEALEKSGYNTNLNLNNQQTTLTEEKQIPQSHLV